MNRYDGEWQNDKRHGKGLVVYKRRDGTPQEKYEVQWIYICVEQVGMQVESFMFDAG